MVAQCRVVGDPSYVPVRACGSCHQRYIYMRRASTNTLKPWCMRCNEFTRIVYVRPEGGHFRDSQKYYSSNPPPGHIEFGMTRYEKTLSPDVQAWFDYAHSDEFKCTDRFESLRKLAANYIYNQLDIKHIDEAARSLAKAREIDETKAHDLVKIIVARCADMLRVNAGREPQIDRAELARDLGLHHRHVYEYSKTATSSSNDTTTGYRITHIYRPPLLRLFDSIHSVVNSFELQLF